MGDERVARVREVARYSAGNVLVFMQTSSKGRPLVATGQTRSSSGPCFLSTAPVKRETMRGDAGDSRANASTFTEQVGLASSFGIHEAEKHRGQTKHVFQIERASGGIVIGGNIIRGDQYRSIILCVFPITALLQFCRVLATVTDNEDDSFSPRFQRPPRRTMIGADNNEIQVTPCIRHLFGKYLLDPRNILVNSTPAVSPPNGNLLIFIARRCLLDVHRNSLLLAIN